MPKKFAMLGRTDAKRRRKEKLANSSAKIILDVLPLIGIAATVAMIPSSKRRKNAAIKMIRKEFDEQFGARPLRRFIQSKIENLLAQKILREEVKRGNKVNVTVDASNEIQITVVS